RTRRRTGSRTRAGTRALMLAAARMSGGAAAHAAAVAAAAGTAAAATLKSRVFDLRRPLVLLVVVLQDGLIGFGRHDVAGVAVEAHLQLRSLRHHGAV